MPPIPQSPLQQGLGALAPGLNLQRGPGIGPVRTDFTHQECAPPPPPPRGGRPRCRLLRRPGKCCRGAPPRPVTTLLGWPPTPQTAPAGRAELGADPTLRLSLRGPGGRQRRVRLWTSQRPDPQDQDRPPPRPLPRGPAREGAPFPWDF